MVAKRYDVFYGEHEIVIDDEVKCVARCNRSICEVSAVEPGQAQYRSDLVSHDSYEKFRDLVRKRFGIVIAAEDRPCWIGAAP